MRFGEGYCLIIFMEINIKFFKVFFFNICIRVYQFQVQYVYDLKNCYF